MPHLHDDKSSDNDDDASRASQCSKSVHSAGEDTCPRKTEESAANQLLSLAALAEEHGKANTDNSEKREATGAPAQKEAQPPSPSPSLAMSRPPYEDGRPPMTPGMANPWGMVGHPGARFPGYYRPGVMHPMYASPMMAAAAGGIPSAGPEHAMRQGSAGGGFPMWAAAPPRPPYHPHMHRGPPPQIPPAFRGHISPSLMTRKTSSNDDDNSVASGKRSAPKQVSQGSPVTKSILKKARIETSVSASDSPDADSDESQAREVKASDDAADGDKQTNESTVDSVVVEKGSVASEDAATKKQRIISPASSNDSPKADDHLTVGGEGTLSPNRRNLSYDSCSIGSPPHPYSAPPFRMGGLHPAAHGLHPGAHHPGRPYIPPSPVYHHHGMRPFSVAGLPPGMYPPPRSMSARGRPGYPAMRPFYARGRMDATASPCPSSPGDELRDERNLDKAPQAVVSAPLDGTSKRLTPSVRSLEGLSNVSGNASRCIPLAQPVSNKYWSDSDVSKDAVLPDFHRLVNFPDLLVKGRSGTGESDHGSACGKKRCVMCGQLRVSATYVRASKKTNPGEVEEPSSSPTPCASSNAGGGSSHHIIPRQNKGVCTACDVTVWVALEMEGLEIKWCKGCKNFRPWAAFGSKGTATKCVRCRDRQKEKYAMQKSAIKRRTSAEVEVEEKKTSELSDHHNMDQHHCSLAIVAADGLRNLMKAAR